MRRTPLLVIHCSATPPSMDIGVSEIDQWHKDRGWRGVGYHYVVRRDGTVEKGREDHVVGAHAKGYNSKSLSICLVGGVDADTKPQDNFTPEQKNALRTLIKELRGKYDIYSIVGHRDLPGVAKACPSFDVVDFIYHF